MKLREQLKAKQAELLALKDAIENGDQEAITKADELADAIKSLEDSIAKAEKASAILNNIGTPEGEEVIEDTAKGGKVSGMKSLQNQAKAVDKSKKGWSISASFKGGTEFATSAPQLADIDKGVDVGFAKRIADNFGQLRISGNAVTYFKETTPDTEEEADGIGIVGQNQKKGKELIDYEPVTKGLVKIAGYTKETDELLDDAEFLASAVRDTMVYRLTKQENNYVVNTINSEATSYEYDRPYTEEESEGDVEKETANIVATMESILGAKMEIEETTPYTADTVIMSPGDYYRVMKAKDANGQYYGGGWFSGAYGNGNYNGTYSPWGLTLLTSNRVSNGSPIVLAAKEAVKIYRKNDVAVKIYDQNEDDAIYNRVTVIAEERILAAVKNALAVLKLQPSE